MADSSMSVEGLEASEVDVYPGPKQSMKRKWEQVTEIPDPADRTDVVASHIEGYAPIEGYEVLVVPSRAKSRLYHFGRKVQTTVDGERKISFVCLATENCRKRSAAGAFIGLGAGTSTNATDHLNKKHGIGANGSGGADVTQASWERRVVQVEQSQSYKTDKKRFLGLYWVRANVIGEFAPLDRGESFDQRVLWSMVCHRDFPLTWLHRKAIKHSVVELYKEMTTIFRDGLREQIKGGCVSHISFDLWTDKFSTLKCHGIRLSLVTDDWELESRLLAVRQFNPPPEVLSNTRVSDFLESYVNTVMEEFHLERFSIYSFITNAERDVNGRGDTAFPGKREGCVCHMLKCALLEAIGTHLDANNRNNELARSIIVMIKQVIEHIRKSPTIQGEFITEQAELYSGFTRSEEKNAPIHRWSALADLLGFFILNSDAITATFHREGTENLLDTLGLEIREIYSIVKPVTEIMVNAQATNLPTGPDIVLQLCALKVTALNPDAPLEIRIPEQVVAPGATDSAQALAPVTSVMRSHEDLTSAAKETRLLLRRSISWRWYDKRYGTQDTQDTDYVFEMQLVMHPATARLSHVDVLCDDKNRAAEIKKTIFDRVVKLAVELAVKLEKTAELAPSIRQRPPESDYGNGSGTGGKGGVRGEDSGGNGGSENDGVPQSQTDPGHVRNGSSSYRGGGNAHNVGAGADGRGGRGGRRYRGGSRGRAGGDGRGHSDWDGNCGGGGGSVTVRLSLGGKSDEAMFGRYADLGLVRAADTMSAVPKVKSHEDIVKEELSDFQEIENCTLDLVPLRHTLVFWKMHADRFPYMARVARVVLGAPASAAVIERDLSAAGRMMTSARSSSDTGLAEMILFLHGNKDLIPDNVTKLTPEQALGAVPSRLRNPISVLTHLDGPFHPVLDGGDGQDETVYEGDDGVLAGITAGKCLVDCATLTPEHMISVEKRVVAKGGSFLEAPVSGSKGQAAGGTLIFLCGGDETLFERVKGSMDGTMGKAAHFFGPVGTGSKMKLVVNMTMGTMMNSLTEGIALAQAADLPADKLLTVLDQGAMQNPMFKMKGKAILDGSFEPAFPLKHAQKDMRFAVALGDCLGLSLPVAAAANEQFKRARGEHGDEDFCAVYQASKK